MGTLATSTGGQTDPTLAALREVFARQDRLGERQDQLAKSLQQVAQTLRTLQQAHDRLAGAVARFCAAVDSDPHMHAVMSAWREDAGEEGRG